MAAEERQQRANVRAVTAAEEKERKQQRQEVRWMAAEERQQRTHERALRWAEEKERRRERQEVKRMAAEERQQRAHEKSLIQAVTAAKEKERKQQRQEMRWMAAEERQQRAHTKGLRWAKEKERRREKQELKRMAAEERQQRTHQRACRIAAEKEQRAEKQGLKRKITEQRQQQVEGSKVNYQTLQAGYCSLPVLEREETSALSAAVYTDADGRPNKRLKQVAAMETMQPYQQPHEGINLHKRLAPCQYMPYNGDLRGNWQGENGVHGQHGSWPEVHVPLNINNTGAMHAAPYHLNPNQYLSELSRAALVREK